MQDEIKPSRRSYLKATGATALGVTTGLAGCSGGSDDGLGDQLNLFTWGSTYADDEFVEPFEEEHDCEVTTEVYTSNADMINKVRSQPEGTYDVCQPTNYAVERMMANDLLEPINLDNVPAYKEHVFDDLKLDAFKNGGEVYAIPQVFGATALMYNTDMEVETPPSIDVLWDDTYKGRLSSRDNAKVQVFYAALKTGQDPNNPDDLDAIESALEDHVSLVRTFWSSGSESQEIMKSGEVDLMTAWDGSYRQLADAGDPVGYTGFKEGTKGWIDTQAIVKGAEHKELAEKWLDYCVDEAARDWFELNGYAIPSSAVDYSEKEKEKFKLDSETLNSYIFQKMVTEDEQKKYDEIWTRVKSSA